MQIIADFEITDWDEQPQLTMVRKRFRGGASDIAAAARHNRQLAADPQIHLR